MIALADLVFKVLRTIEYLPPWPGARWNALFRLAAKAAGIDPEAAYEALVPERWGPRPWLAGEETRIRIVFQVENFPLTLAFLGSLFRGGIGEGFSAGQTLGLTGLAWPYGPEAGLVHHFPLSRLSPPPWPEDWLHREAAALRRLNGPFSLVFRAPLRLYRPVEAPGCGEYIGPEFFTWGRALPYLLARVRYLPGLTEDELGGLRAAPGGDLVWLDRALIRERSMKLGGVTGRLLVQGRLSPAAAGLLVAGQYLGVGKNGRFGFGFYRIPELDSHRPWPLFPSFFS